MEKGVILTTTISPAMMQPGFEGRMEVREISEAEAVRLVRYGLKFQRDFEPGFFLPAIGHENTADMLQRRWQIDTPLFGRVNVVLDDPATILVAAVPQARFESAREFTDEEIASVPFRFFEAEVFPEAV